jgi:Tol biopolymer transport system component
VFVRERGRFARKTLISAATEREPGTGAQGNGPSLVLAMTPDASKVLFLSAASNLVSGDTNGQPDIFLRDRRTRTTTRVSVPQGHGQANGPSRLGSISADGRYVAFDSRASNLVPGDDNGRSDVFIRDLVRRTTTRISVGCAGTAILSGCYGGSMSADGRYIAYEATPPDGITQAYAYDRLSGLTRMVSEGEHGEPGNGLTFRPAVSPSGRYVSFESFSSNLVHGGDALRTYHVYVRDLQTATTTRASVNAAGEPGDDMSTHAAISDCAVAFESRAGNLVPAAVQGDTQVYLRTP